MQKPHKKKINKIILRNFKMITMISQESARSVGSVTERS